MNPIAMQHSDIRRLGLRTLTRDVIIFQQIQSIAAMIGATGTCKEDRPAHGSMTTFTIVSTLMNSAFSFKAT